MVRPPDVHAALTGPTCWRALVLVEDSLVVDATILGVLLAAAVALVALTRGRLGFDHRPAPVPERAADVGRVVPAGR